MHCWGITGPAEGIIKWGGGGGAEINSHLPACGSYSQKRAYKYKLRYKTEGTIISILRHQMSLSIIEANSEATSSSSILAVLSL